MPRLSRTLTVLLAFGLASPAATAAGQPYGDLALADRLLAEAEALAPQLEERWHFRPMLHARIGLVRVQLGEEDAAERAFAEAVHAAEAIEDPYVGAVGLASVLRHQARIGGDPALTLAAFERQLTPPGPRSEADAIDRFDRLRLLIEAAHGAARDDRNEHVARAALSLARRILDGLRHDGGDGGAGLRLEALCLMADAYAELPDKTSAERLADQARALLPPRAEGVGGRLSVIESLARLGREEDALALAREVDAEEEALAAVAVFDDTPELGRLVVRAALAAASSDGILGPEEEKAVQALCDALGLEVDELRQPVRRRRDEPDEDEIDDEE